MISTERPVILARTVRLLMELRRNGIADSRVLGAIEKTPRELFVPGSFEDQAWENIALPIDSGQTISQPLVVALMTENLQIGDRDKVLEIGTGSGYQTAILSRLARRVFTVERHRGLLREAERRFSALRLGNIISRFGDGFKGWAEQAPFDRIIVTAAAPEVPTALVDQLSPGGILIMPVGAEHRDQRLVRVRHQAGGDTTDDLGWVRFVPLVAGLPRAEAPSRERENFEVD
ncbi:MAG TPA: protein-L-isoaspartate(D-aspartate) O-methyltransferase [Stellaceae bacterium]|jgi:protein-L-isoaspartate(D-aspartate) O-methyltransferase|nr:protein-L-isoaspartate(D-aspartate) O-methyltransferase [Stellaceae bacterium]